MARYVKETAEELIYSAENDIISVKELLTGTHYPADRKYNNIYYHSSQAVEKFFKSYIISNGKMADKTHDLTILLRTVVKFDNSFENINDRRGRFRSTGSYGS